MICLIDFIVKLQKQFDIPALHFVLFGIIGISWFLYVVFGPGLLCNAAGFIYPLYASYKAIESKSRDEDTQWLTYWAIYALFTVIETFDALIVKYFPYYFAIKFGLLLWLFSPNTLGAEFIYINFIKPYLFDNEYRIDSIEYEQVDVTRYDDEGGVKFEIE